MKLLQKLLQRRGPAPVAPIETTYERRRSWRQDIQGYVYVTPLTVGRAGTEWPKHFTREGIFVTPEAMAVIQGPDFAPLKPLVPVETVIIRNRVFEGDMTNQKVWALMEARELTKVNAEIACSLLDHISYDDMRILGVKVLTIWHQPCVVGGIKYHLALRRDDSARKVMLDASPDNPEVHQLMYVWDPNATGIVLGLPQQ